MSGGHFQYKYLEFGEFAEDLEYEIEANDIGEFQNNFDEETIDILTRIKQYIDNAGRLAKAVEWLYSGDTSGTDLKEFVKTCNIPLPSAHLQPQPAPKEGGEPVWPAVIEALLEERNCNEDEFGDEGLTVFDAVVADMRERDKQGREKYGTPLCFPNGRNFAVDVYQEILDAIVYLHPIKERFETENTEWPMMGVLFAMAIVIKHSLMTEGIYSDE